MSIPIANESHYEALQNIYIEILFILIYKSLQINNIVQSVPSITAYLVRFDLGSWTESLWKFFERMKSGVLQATTSNESNAFISQQTKVKFAAKDKSCIRVCLCFFLLSWIPFLNWLKSSFRTKCIKNIGALQIKKDYPWAQTVFFLAVPTPCLGEG